MAINLGDAILKLGADDTQLKSKMADAEQGIAQSTERMAASFRKVGTVMMGVGVGIGAAMLKMANDYSKAGDEVYKMSQRTGWATEELSKLRYMANLSGTSIGTMEISIRRLSQNLIAAEDSTGTANRAFERLNLNVAELRALSPEQQFWATAHALAAVEDPAEKAALAVELFGRAGTDMLPMLAEGTEGIARMGEEAEKANQIFSEDSAKAASDFETAKGELVASFEGLGHAIGELVIEDLKDFVELLKETVQNIKDWVKENPDLVDDLKELAKVLAVGGGLLVGLSTLASILKSIAAAIGVIKLIALGPVGIGIAAAALAAGIGYLGYRQTVKGMEQFREVFGAGGQFGPALPSIPATAEPFGGLAGGGGHVTVNVQGSVITERQLTEVVRDAMVDIDRHNAGLGFAGN